MTYGCIQFGSYIQLPSLSSMDPSLLIGGRGAIVPRGIVRRAGFRPPYIMPLSEVLRQNDGWSLASRSERLKVITIVVVIKLVNFKLNAICETLRSSQDNNVSASQSSIPTNQKVLHRHSFYVYEVATDVQNYDHGFYLSVQRLKDHRSQHHVTSVEPQHYYHITTRSTVAVRA